MVKRSFFANKKAELYSIIKYCKENIPYYRESWKFALPNLTDFSLDFFETHIPILEKKEAIINNDLIIAESVDKKSLMTESTSGTEGSPLVCYKSPEDWLAYSNLLWKQRRKRVKSLKPKDKFAHFFAFRMIDNELVGDQIIQEKNTLHIPLVNLSKERLKASWKSILKFKPKWLQGPASAVYNLARTVLDNNLAKLKIEFIELSGEFVPMEYISVIKEAFSCQIGNHYGSREFWVIAYSCENEHLHIIDDNVYLETIHNLKHDANEVVATSLTNKSWPLVRYKLGDLADIEEIKDCDCSFTQRFCLKIKRARRADYFKLKGSRNINAILFSVIAKKIRHPKNHNLTVILQYQVMKKSDSALILNLRVDPNIRDYQFIIDKFNYELRKIFANDIHFEFNFVDFIPLDKKTGKHREFIDLTRRIKGG